MKKNPLTILGDVFFYFLVSLVFNVMIPPRKIWPLISAQMYDFYLFNLSFQPIIKTQPLYFHKPFVSNLFVPYNKLKLQKNNLPFLIY